MSRDKRGVVNPVVGGSSPPATASGAAALVGPASADIRPVAAVSRHGTACTPVEVWFTSRTLSVWIEVDLAWIEFPPSIARHISQLTS
jgi:hypothetical protein